MTPVAAISMKRSGVTTPCVLLSLMAQTFVGRKEHPDPVTTDMFCGTENVASKQHKERGKYCTSSGDRLCAVSFVTVNEC